MKKIAFLATAALLVLAACNREDPVRPSAAQPITVDASIGVPTRAATNGNSEVFETGDKVTLFAWTGNAASVPGQLVVDGVVNELLSDGTWKPASYMFWADFTSPHYFLGVYPARTVSNFKADSFTLNPADYEASDLLIALETTGLKASEDPVKLTFNHLMAKFQLNLNFRSQWTETPEAKAFATAATSCKVDYLAFAVEAGEPGSVALAKLASPAKGYALSYGGLLIPQTGFRTVTLTIDGKDYVYTHSEDLQLASGKTTFLNLTVGRDRIETGTMVISEWTDGEAFDGEILNEE